MPSTEQLEEIRAKADALAAVARNDVSEKDLETARAMRAAGKTWYAVAQALGIEKNATAVRNVLDPEFASKRHEEKLAEGKARWAETKKKPWKVEEENARQRRRYAEKKSEAPAGSGGGRGLPYLGKARSAYFQREDSMGDVVRFADVRHSADDAVARMDAYAQNRARGDATRTEKYEALRKGTAQKAQKESASPREEITDPNGVTFDGKVAYFAGGIFRRGSFARPKSGGFGLFKGKRVFFVDKIKVSGGIVTAYGLVYENGLDDKSPVERYYPVSELIPSPPLR